VITRYLSYRLEIYRA